MKRGRPYSHIKAKWITWNKNGESLFYELDMKGNLIKSDNSNYVQYPTNHTLTKNDKPQQHEVKLSGAHVLQQSAEEVEDANIHFCTSGLNDAVEAKQIQTLLSNESVFDEQRELDFFALFDHFCNEDSSMFDPQFNY